VASVTEWPFWSSLSALLHRQLVGEVNQEFTVVISSGNRQDHNTRKVIILHLFAGLLIFNFREVAAHVNSVLVFVTLAQNVEVE
jgi:hypothetical protein